MASAGVSPAGSAAAQAPGESAEASPVYSSLEQAQDALLQLLLRRLLCVDEHPTVTRMFTFKPHVECLLLMDFLGIFDDVVKLRCVQPREQNCKRISKVLAFMHAADTGQFLRRTTLAVCLTDHVQRICAQTNSCTEPLLVRLAKGTVSRVVSNDFFKVGSILHLDPQLDFSSALVLLLSAAVDLSLRLRQYQKWPFLAYKLCRKFNPDGYLQDGMHSVQMPAELLDQGLGAPLLRLVRRAGATDGQRLAFLCSDPLQQALTVAFEASAASSLPAERAFAETKLSEAPRLCHVATASRNQILRQFLRQRSDVLRQAEVAAAALRKSLNTNMSTLAWELNPALSEVALSKRGGSCAMKAFIAQNTARLHAEVDRRRAMAKSAMQRVEGFETPVTRQAWIHWFRRHQDVFYQEMRESGEKRRAANRRLQASDACPPIGVRLFPPASDETPDRVTEPWMKLLTRRSGWHVVRLVSNELRLFFLFFFKRVTHCLDFSIWRQGRDFVLQQLPGFVLNEHIQPLAQVEFDEEVAELLEVGINVRFKGLPSTVRLSVVAARTVTAPVHRDNRKRRRNGDPVVDGHDSSGEDSEDLLPDLSSASSCASVDTDVDSAVDDCAEGPAVQQRHDNVVDKIHGRQGAKVLGSIGAHGHGSTHVSRVVGDIAAVGSATSFERRVGSI